MSRRYLVTGAAGFLGNVLTRKLHESGVPVRAMVRSAAQQERLEAQGIETVLGDLTKPETLAPAVEGIHGVYHIAALFRQAGLPDEEFYRINVAGTKAMLDASIAAGVQRFIHCSTVGVLGHIARPPADETTEYSPGDIYQQTKMEGELLALEYFRSGRIGGVVVRPGMIWGPGDERTLKLFRMIARGKFFYVGDGTANVHFVDVRDVAQGFILAMEHPEIQAEIYIVAGERPVPLKELVEMIAARFGVPAPKLHLPVRPMQLLGTICEAICTPLGISPPIFRRRVDFFTKQRHFSFEKAMRELGYRPAQSLEGEVDDIIASYRTANAL